MVIIQIVTSPSVILGTGGREFESRRPDHFCRYIWAFFAQHRPLLFRVFDSELTGHLVIFIVTITPKLTKFNKKKLHILYSIFFGTQNFSYLGTESITNYASRIFST